MAQSVWLYASVAEEMGEPGELRSCAQGARQGKSGQRRPRLGGSSPRSANTGQAIGQLGPKFERLSLAEFVQILLCSVSAARPIRETQRMRRNDRRCPRQSRRCDAGKKSGWGLGGWQCRPARQDLLVGLYCAAREGADVGARSGRL